jgi:hypothetical protein
MPVFVGIQRDEPQPIPQQPPSPLDNPEGFMKYLWDMKIGKMAYDQVFGQPSSPLPQPTPPQTCTSPPTHDIPTAEILRLKTAQEERIRSENLRRIEELRQQEEKRKREQLQQKEQAERRRAEFQNRQRAIEEARKRRAEETAAFTTAFIEQNNKNTEKFMRSFDQSIRAGREMAENRRAREDASFKQDRKEHALLLRKFDEVSGKIYDRSLGLTTTKPPGLCRSTFQNEQQGTSSPATTQEQPMQAPSIPQSQANLTFAGQQTTNSSADNREEVLFAAGTVAVTGLAVSAPYWWPKVQPAITQTVTKIKEWLSPPGNRNAESSRRPVTMFAKAASPSEWVRIF